MAGICRKTSENRSTPEARAQTNIALGRPVSASAATWVGQIGVNYTIFGNPDLRAGTLAEINDNVDSDGNSTTRMFTDLNAIGKTRYFYQVVKNPRP